MGLFKAIGSAIGGSMQDQWKEFIYCDALPTDVLLRRGQKRTGAKSSNKGDENIISDGSVVAVNDGQFMMIVEQGQIVDFCGEAGQYTFDSKTSPSLFTGGFSKGILNTFKDIGKRFTFGGDTGRDQRVYYVNTKEIMGNKYGTANPVPFRVVDNNIGLDIDIAIRCFGEYSYKVVDPLLFYKNVAGNVTADYRRNQIDEQLKSELMTALQPAFAKLSAAGIRYSALPGHTQDIADALNEILSAKWSDLRGLAVAAFGVSSVKAPEEDEAMIKELQRNAVLRNPNMAAAHMVSAQADAMRSAAKNEATGPMFAFAGMNMAQNAGGMNAQNLFAMGQQQQQQAPPPPPPAQAPNNGWKCECGATNAGKFCGNCGATAPADALGWKCACGTVNKGKFCAECGGKKPGGAFSYKCDKCGWEPDDPTKPPKFCPECGDLFDENDRR
ncbi:MAG: SPFH domain-containing protein [Clostridiales bacterium]|nr:SPFH domain-containing protein [Clostridiales bacterium]